MDKTNKAGLTDGPNFLKQIIEKDIAAGKPNVVTRFPP